MLGCFCEKFFVQARIIDRNILKETGNYVIINGKKVLWVKIVSEVLFSKSFYVQTVKTIYEVYIQTGKQHLKMYVLRVKTMKVLCS